SSSRSRAVAKMTSAAGTLVRISFSTCRPSVSGRCQSRMYRSNDSRARERCLVGVVLEIRDSHASPLRRGALGASCGEALEELLPLPAHRFDVALLDVAEAANLFGERRELDRAGVVLRAQAGEELLERLLVLADQLALHAPLFGTAEGIERRSSEELQP